DFVITRSLSLADAAVHLIHNPHGQRLLSRIPENLLNGDYALWPPLDYVVRRIAEPQVAITLGLSILSFGFWVALKLGIRRPVLIVTAVVVAFYLTLVALVTLGTLFHVANHLEIWHAWLESAWTVGQPAGAIQGAATSGRLSAWLFVILWSF